MSETQTTKQDPKLARHVHVSTQFRTTRLSSSPKILSQTKLEKNPCNSAILASKSWESFQQNRGRGESQFGVCFVFFCLREFQKPIAYRIKVVFVDILGGYNALTWFSVSLGSFSVSERRGWRTALSRLPRLLKFLNLSVNHLSLRGFSKPIDSCIPWKNQ